MKRQRHGKQVLAVLLAFCLFLPAVFSTPAAVPAADTGLNSQMTPEEQQSYLEMKLRQTEKTLETLGKQSKDTQAYLDALDQKIGYLRSQLKLTEQKVDTAENRITVLQKQQKKNRQDQAALQQQITDTKQQITVLDAQFQQNYQRYCQRLRAMYISGETNVLAFLLGSTDIGQLLTRYEMVARVAKQDTALLRSVQTEGTRLEQAKTDLTARQKDLQTKKTALAASQTELEQTVTTLQADQKDLTSRRQVLTDQQTEANRLLKQLTDKTKAYTEYRDVTQNDLDEIDRQIEEAAKKYTTTTTTTTTTTKKHTTTKHGGSAGTTASTTKKHTTTESKRLRLTYPVPSQTRITTAFHGYAGHSGCDFACASGSRVVAAESGTVIVSADLTNSDGSYRSYGRYIVIAHDKTDSVGNSVYTLYAHNSRRVVSAGTHVHRGQLIAYSGSTGNSTGPHCHFEVRTPTASYNDCVNPEIYLP